MVRSKDSNNKKLILDNYKCLDVSIKQMYAEIEEWRSLAEKVTSSPIQTKGNASINKIELSIEKINELQNKILTNIRLKTLLRIEIEKAIDSLENENLQLIIKYHYVAGLSLEDIAAKLNYSIRQVGRLHKKALDNIIFLTQIIES